MSTLPPSTLALNSLPPQTLSFIHNLPKAELHAHLNGCIPLKTLLSLSNSYHLIHDPQSPYTSLPPSEITSTLTQFENFSLTSIHGFFAPFKVIYALCSTVGAVERVTKDVLASFLLPPRGDGEEEGEEGEREARPECDYIELRTTPREGIDMTYSTYITTVLSQIETYPPTQASLILSLDRRMSPTTLRTLSSLAISLKRSSRRIVGIDLCGDPLAGDDLITNGGILQGIINDVKGAGLGVTLHIAEVSRSNLYEETRILIGFGPDRLGHATFLDEELREIVRKERMAIEICLSSNLLCKTVPSLESHHIRHYLTLNHPIAICTDDTLPFRTTLTSEYALLLAQPPLGLGLTHTEVSRIASMSFSSRFNPT